MGAQLYKWRAWATRVNWRLEPRQDFQRNVTERHQMEFQCSLWFAPRRHMGMMYLFSLKNYSRSSPGTNNRQHLLLLKSKSPMPPVFFRKEDLFSRRRWRQIQYLSYIFWKRWSKEYLPLLQSRQKWLYPRRNLAVGDVVLVAAERNQQEFLATRKSSWSLSGQDGLCSQSLSQLQVVNSRAFRGQASLTGWRRGMKIHLALNDLFSVFSLLLYKYKRHWL